MSIKTLVKEPRVRARHPDWTSTDGWWIHISFGRVFHMSNTEKEIVRSLSIFQTAVERMDLRLWYEFADRCCGRLAWRRRRSAGGRFGRMSRLVTTVSPTNPLSSIKSTVLQRDFRRSIACVGLSSRCLNRLIFCQFIRKNHRNG